MYIVKKFFKSIFSIITTLTIAVSCVSCSDKSNASIEGIPVQLEDEKAWSIVSPDGEILVKNAFEASPSFVYNGRFVVYEKDGFYVYDINNPNRALNQEPFAQLTDYFNGKAFGVRKGAGICIVDTDGNVVKTLDNSIVAISNEGVGDADMVVYSNDQGLSGYINLDGDIVIPAKWADAAPFSEKLAVVYNGNKYMCIDANEQIVFTLKDDETPGYAVFVDGWLAVNKDDCGRFVNHKGETVLKLPSNTMAYMRVGERVITHNKDGWQLLVAEEDGAKILKGYEDIMPMGSDGDCFVVKKHSNSNYNIVNANGEDICSQDFKTVFTPLIRYGFIIGGDEKPFNLFDCNGKSVNVKLDIDCASDNRYKYILPQRRAEGLVYDAFGLVLEDTTEILEYQD